MSIFQSILSHLYHLIIAKSAITPSILNFNLIVSHHLRIYQLSRYAIFYVAPAPGLVQPEKFNDEYFFLLYTMTCKQKRQNFQKQSEIYIKKLAD